MHSRQLSDRRGSIQACEGTEEQVAGLECSVLSFRGCRYLDDEHGLERCGESGSIGDAELDIDVVKVALDRSRREVQPVSDLLGGAPRGGERRYFPLALGQP